MQIHEVPRWQVFTAVVDHNEWEYVILPLDFIRWMDAGKRLLVRNRKKLTIPLSVPVNAVQLSGLEWERLDGMKPVISLRPNSSSYHPGSLATLNLWEKEWQQSRDCQKQPDPTQTKPEPPAPSVAKEAVVQQAGKVHARLGYKNAPKQLAVDPTCISAKAEMELFAGTSVAREVLEAARFGLRNKLRR